MFLQFWQFVTVRGKLYVLQHIIQVSLHNDKLNTFILLTLQERGKKSRLVKEELFRAAIM